MQKPINQPAPEVGSHVAAPWIEIFRAGTHTDASGKKMTFTEAHLDEIVASYDPAVHEAPVVVGHPKVDDPALGWIFELKREGDVLYSRERDVQPEFEEARESGMYRKRSASFYLPKSAGNPTPGKFYLRHVGWLGAMPPAIKGMADKLKQGAVAFGEDDGEGVIEFNDMAVDFGDGDAPRWIARPIASVMDNLRDFLVEAVGIDKADRIVPRYQIDAIREAGLVPETRPLGFGEGDEDGITDPNEPPNPEEDAAMTQQAQEQLAADQAKLEADRAELERQQAEFNERQAAADKAAADEQAAEQLKEATDFADSLVAGGQLLPAKKAGVVALIQVAQQIEQPLNFGEGDDAEEKPAIDIVRDVLSGLPKQIDFAEKSGEGEAVRTADFSAPTGSAIDSDKLDQLNKAQVYMKDHPNVTLMDAVKAIGG